MLFAVAMMLASTAPAMTIIIETDFEVNNLSETGLEDFEVHFEQSLSPGNGIGGSTALDNIQDGGHATPQRTIDPGVAFEMFGLYQPPAFHPAGGAMGIMWTQADQPFNTFFGTGGASKTDHAAVAIAHLGSHEFSLASVNGGLNISFGGGQTFGSAPATLTPNHWYRLEGSIFFDSTNKSLLFKDISLDDFGTDGTTEIQSDLLVGSTNLAVPTFGDEGRLLFATNRDRGITLTDNYRVEAIPEPPSWLLGSIALTLFCVFYWRRRVYHALVCRSARANTPIVDSK